MSRKPKTVSLCLVVWLALTAQQCPDQSAPALRLQVTGMSRLLTLDESSPGPELRRAQSADRLILTATATDRESGVATVDVRADIQIICIPTTGVNRVVIADPVVQTTAAPGSPEGFLRHEMRIGVSDQRQRCPATTRFLELKIDVKAQAKNGRGLVRQLPTATVYSFGPDVVAVATFNLYNPGNHADSVFEAWGKELGSQADVLLLTEVRDRRTAQILAAAAGMHVLLMNDETAGLAIASRGPIRKISEHVVEPGGSTILAAWTDLDGYPHQVVVTHWGFRDAQGRRFAAHESMPARVQAADRILAVLAPPPAIAFVGGDLNAYSGVGPQREPGGTAEVARIASEMTDSFVSLRMTDDRHCSDQRIDYVFSRGPVVPRRYEACFTGATPSDHPFVLVTYEAQ
jgi:endonuclease/exonuclease/phosphatase (EEP) superfamily protein YafD